MQLWSKLCDFFKFLPAVIFLNMLWSTLLFVMLHVLTRIVFISYLVSCYIPFPFGQGSTGYVYHYYYDFEINGHCSPQCWCHSLMYYKPGKIWRPIKDLGLLMARRRENLWCQEVTDPTTERTAVHPNRPVGIHWTPTEAVPEQMTVHHTRPGQLYPAFSSTGDRSMQPWGGWCPALHHHSESYGQVHQ